MSSLVVISHLHSDSDPSATWGVRGPTYGAIVDIGFSDGPDDVLYGRPPRPKTTPYEHAGWMQDRFLYVARREGGSSLGTLKLAEALVQDTYMRGPIDFTGIGLSLHLRPDAYEAYVAYVGRFPAGFSNTDGWDGRIKFRIPSRPFRFPMPRGSLKPWDTGTRGVGRLRPIQQFEFDETEVEALGRQIAGGDPPLESGLDLRGKLSLPPR